VLVSFLYAYVIVSLADIELCEYDGSAEVADEVSDEWERVLITNRPSVDFPVVLYWSQFAVLFLNKEEG
jgi:hypothetical protein